eukprot:GHRR01037483.1.p1 GENE.GHRR01037483.1~~GHRR01037483.1.p1  ORF type:complete len:129 (+),score=15.20 GHRR01037483.1:353-739(+)
MHHRCRSMQLSRPTQYANKLLCWAAGTPVQLYNLHCKAVSKHKPARTRRSTTPGYVLDTLVLPLQHVDCLNSVPAAKTYRGMLLQLRKLHRSCLVQRACHKNCRAPRLSAWTCLAAYCGGWPGQPDTG